MAGFDDHDDDDDDDDVDDDDDGDDDDHDGGGDDGGDDDYHAHCAHCALHRCYVGPMTVKRKDFTPVTSGPRVLVKRFQNNHSP